jgi:hypothetical protein
MSLLFGSNSYSCNTPVFVVENLQKETTEWRKKAIHQQYRYRIYKKLKRVLRIWTRIRIRTIHMFLALMDPDLDPSIIKQK